MRTPIAEAGLAVMEMHFTVPVAGPRRRDHRSAVFDTLSSGPETGVQTGICNRLSPSPLSATGGVLTDGERPRALHIQSLNLALAKRLTAHTLIDTGFLRPVGEMPRRKSPGNMQGNFPEKVLCPAARYHHPLSAGCGDLHSAGGKLLRRRYGR